MLMLGRVVGADTAESCGCSGEAVVRLIRSAACQVKNDVRTRPTRWRYAASLSRSVGAGPKCVQGAFPREMDAR